ncbi:DUF3311 domain-containing protein [Streptomyces sp. NPDC050560]|uniref:DUF3311 domain-containing protein n=1 Tax=Streptomyces sp. NPDC050560 TaxID=3365630 RepID=UPI0037B3BAF9
MPKVPEASKPVVTPVRVIIGVCLVAPFVAMLWVGSFARVDPRFIGIPFFYWYQMLWVLISSALTAIAYQLWKYDQRSRGLTPGGARRAGTGGTGGAPASDTSKGGADR